MLGLILNETEIVNKTLIGGLDLPSKPSKVIRMIIKNMIINNNSDNDIKELVSKLLEKNYGKNYNKNYWSKYIDSTVKSLKKKENKMIDVDKVNIYKEELETIKSLNDIRLEKLAFILLVYCKINKQVNPLINNKINIALTNILFESLIKRDDNSKILLNKLYKKEFIHQGNSCDGTAIQILYIRNEGEIEFTIDDLRDYQPITWYLEYRQGIKYKKCEKCGKRFEVKGKNNKYCNYCSKKIKKEKTNERVKEFNKKQKH